MSKTTILDLASRKLAPFMLLFGFYLLTYGHISPGGGFQGGVVIASGVILLAISRGVEAAEFLFPIKNLLKVEAFVFFLLLLVGVSGIIAGIGFLGNPIERVNVKSMPRAGMFLLLNILIGLKVGAGVSLICLYLFNEEE